MPRMQILSPSELSAFDTPPQMNAAQRKTAFDLPLGFQMEIERLRDPAPAWLSPSGWATRKVLSWRPSNTMDANFCVEALNEAIIKYGKPKIMNTDQWAQFTRRDWINILADAEIKISMDGRGRYLNNIFIERLWLSLKQEAISP